MSAPRFRAILVTVSTSRDAAGTEAASAGDRTGQVLAEVVAAHGGLVVGQHLVADDVAAIRALVTRLAGEAEVLVLAGGTGVAPADVTPEALLPLLDRPLPGFGERMRAAGAANPKVGARAYLSRSCAGIRGRCLVLAIPGSPGGARDSLEAVAPLIPHVVDLVAGEVRSCQDELPRTE